MRDMGLLPGLGVDCGRVSAEHGGAEMEGIGLSLLLQDSKGKEGSEGGRNAENDGGDQDLNGEKGC